MQISAVGSADSAERVQVTPETFAAQYLGRVHRFAVMVSPLGVEPDDLAQEAMVRALANLDRFDPSRGSMDVWLWRIVVNLARDAGRMAGRTELLIERLATQSGMRSVEVSAEAAALDRLRNRDLVDAIRRLPRRYRSLIALRYGGGLSFTQIAALLETTPMAVIKATRRALDRLRKDLEVQR
jgi:RNA polymerase sigma-70 factor (ECF subfamily)